MKNKKFLVFTYISFILFLFTLSYAAWNTNDHVSFYNNQAGNLNDPNNPIIDAFEDSNVGGVGIIISPNEYDQSVIDWEIFDKWIDTANSYNKDLYFNLTGSGYDTPNNNGIEIYSRNNFYWQYDGKPVLLIGASDDDTIFQWEENRLIEHLDLLESSGGNYIRNTMSFRRFDDGYKHDLPQPFKQNSNGKYDLDEWNEEYWDKLKFFLEETKKRDIVVQLELWDNGNYLKDAWSVNAFNPKNNNNYNSLRLKNYKATAPWFDFFDAVPGLDNDANLYKYQKKFVERLLDETLAYDHVLYQIDNESGMDHKASKHWAEFVHSYAKSKGVNRQLYVAESRRFHSPSYLETEMTVFEHPSNNQPIKDYDVFTYIDIAQNGGNTGYDQYFNLMWYRQHTAGLKVRPVNHVKTYWMNWGTGADWKSRESVSVAEGTQKFWRNIFGGAASVRFHRWNSLNPEPGIGLDPPSGAAQGVGQIHLENADKLLSEISIFDMVPNGRLLSNKPRDDIAYALNNDCKEHAIYFTGDRIRTVDFDLRAERGSYTLKWLKVDKKDATWEGSKTVFAGSKIELTPPSAGQWVAVLNDKQGPCRSAQQGLVLHYKFDTNEGGTVTDFSGKNNDGINEDATWTSAGVSGGGLYFDGHAGVQTNGMILNPAVHDITASLWFKTVPRGSDQITKLNFHRLIVQSQKRFGGLIWMTMTGWEGKYALANRFGELYRGDSNLKRGEWNHGVITWQNGVRKIYVNGKLDGVKADSRAESSNSYLHIGRNSFLEDAPFVGTLDDVQIYDKALNANQVKWLHDNPGSSLSNSAIEQDPIPPSSDDITSDILDRYGSESNFQGFFFLGSTSEDSFTSCHLFDSSSTIDNRYGRPYIFGTPNELFFKTQCKSNEAKVELGRSDSNIIFFNKGYVWKNGAWEQFTLSGQSFAGADQWLRNQASATINNVDTSKVNYAVTFACKWDGSRWKCGCNSEACQSTLWNIQAFKK